MATRKASAATALTQANLASGDLFWVTDVSDATDATSGTSKSMTATEVLAGMQGVKYYRALLTQSGTAAPVATVLQNTLGGAVVWARTTTGTYTATLTGIFLASKTFPISSSNGDGLTFPFARTSDNVITLLSQDGGTNGDDLLNAAPVEIIVFP